MVVNSITEEIRQIRHQLAAGCGNDVFRIGAELRRHESESGRTIVRLPKRAPQGEANRSDGWWDERSRTTPIEPEQPIKATHSKALLFRFPRAQAEYSIGLKTTSSNGRIMIHGVAPEFSREPTALKIRGCELLAIRSQNGDIYNFREIYPSTSHQLIRFGLKQDATVTLELYDEVLRHRFAVNWPRKCTNWVKIVRRWRCECGSNFKVDAPRWRLPNIATPWKTFLNVLDFAFFRFGNIIRIG